MNKPGRRPRLAPRRDGPGQTLVDFGFSRVVAREKAGKVAAVFDSVATRYDLMNDVMSFGLHRYWKRFLAHVAALRPGARVLDLAGGTGDLSRHLHGQVGADGMVVLADINEHMLAEGRRRLVDAGVAQNMSYLLLDAERLPFSQNSFHCVCIGFGLRNFTSKERGLREMCRVMKPGGQLLVLEFSKLVSELLRPVYDAYSFQVLPKLGQMIAGDADSYRYLAESIRLHPGQEELKAMIEAAGFERCAYFNLSAGVVALHRAFKL